MLPDRVSNPGPLTYESGALPIALRGPALNICILTKLCNRLMYKIAMLCNSYTRVYMGYALQYVT